LADITLETKTEANSQELDAVSFHHATKTRLANNIPSSSISIRRPTTDQPILFPIYDELASSSAGKWDFVICNPPFFGSEEEMREGAEGKAKGAPAVRLVNPYLPIRQG
jgi:methyltransferase